jgi:hypothetical protein
MRLQARRGRGVGGGAKLGRDIYWVGIYTGSGYILDRMQIPKEKS